VFTLHYPDYYSVTSAVAALLLQLQEQLHEQLHEQHPAAYCIWSLEATSV